MIRSVSFKVTITYNTEAGILDPEWISGGLDAAVETFAYDGRLDRSYEDSGPTPPTPHANYLSHHVEVIPGED